MQALERRTLFEGTVDVDAPLEDAPLDGELASSYTYPNPGGGANDPPVVTVNNSSVSASEGSMATNTGTFTDPNFDFVTFTASLGSVGGGSSGTWTWSYLPPDGHVPPVTQMVTITATDSRQASSQTTFALVVNNVAPQFTLSGAGAVYTGHAFQLGRSAVTDPGQDTISSWTIAWGDGITETVAGNPHSFSHVYTTKGIKNITATATDEDGSYGRSTSAEVKPPEVSVAAGGPASENARRPGGFTVERTGVSSMPLTVYFSLGGSARAFAFEVRHTLGIARRIFHR